MKQSKSLLFLSMCMLLCMGCDDTESADAKENTEELCADSVDNDGDGVIDCADGECMVFAHCQGEADASTGTDTHVAAPTEPEVTVSKMPNPGEAGVPKPAGAPGNLVVLDWAGYKAAVTYTFDDSQPSHIDHYDTLHAQGVPVTFFASNGAGGSSNYDAAFSKAVTDGHEIGNHTVNHCRPDLADCSFGSPAESPEMEIEECSNYIMSNFGQSGVWTMASPYGDGGWNSYAEQYFFLNRGISRGTIAPNDSTNPFKLPAEMVGEGDTAEEFNADIDKTYENGEWLIFCFHSILPTSDEWYANVEIAEIVSSMEHVKSLGDMWADTMANIGAYWRGQKVFSEVTPTTSGQDTIWSWTLPPNFPPGKFLRVTIDGGTLKQGTKVLEWNDHGYYEVSLDFGSLTLSP